MPKPAATTRKPPTGSPDHVVSQPTAGDHAPEPAAITDHPVDRATAAIRRLVALFANDAPAAEPVHLNTTVSEVLEQLQCELDRAQVTVRCELADDVPPLLGIPVQLAQVVSNLVRNAVEAMCQTECRPRELIISTLSHKWQEARLGVRDVGVGISEVDAPRLFESFYTTKPDGLGLGLCISRSIVERHGGRIWATPNDGPGTTFWLSIPCLRRTFPSQRLGETQ